MKNFASMFTVVSHALGFEMEQDIENLKHPPGEPMIDLPFDSETLPTPPLIFTVGLKVRNLTHIYHLMRCIPAV